MRFTLARRDALHLLDASWATSGVYVRVARDASGMIAYVGQAGDLTRRAEQHADDLSIEWSHILLAARTSTPFDEAECTYLEGAVHDQMRKAGCRLRNKVQPGSDRLSEWDRVALNVVATRVWWLLAAMSWAADDHGTMTAPATALHGPALQVPDGSYPVGNDLLAALAESLKLQRAARGSSTVRRPLLIKDHVVGEQRSIQRGFASLTLDASRIAAATRWPPGVVRSTLGSEMNRTPGTDRYQWVGSPVGTLRDFVGQFGLPVGSSPTLTQPTSSVSHDPDTAGACRELVSELRLGDCYTYEHRPIRHILGQTRYGATVVVAIRYSSAESGPGGFEFALNSLSHFGWRPEVEVGVHDRLKSVASGPGPLGDPFVSRATTLEQLQWY